tara:strand:- start:510 stop:1784 length:1275 start_codon:yes stop_codon:yes gene_type:complete
MSILIVHDDEGFRVMLATALSEAGHSDVVTAESAADAFDKLGLDDPSADLSPVDLILMDISLPEIDGVEPCRCLKANSRFRDLPLIMVTGSADATRLAQTLTSGEVDPTTKPPDHQDMLGWVGSAMEAKPEIDHKKVTYFLDDPDLIYPRLREKTVTLESTLTELGEKNKELEQVSLAKTQILSTASHELKTPLTSIVGYVDRMLLREATVGPLNETQRRYLATVRRNAHRLKSLVDDLLDISRIEAGSLELTLSDLEVKQEVGEALQSMQTQIQEKQIQVSTDISPDVGPIRADRLRFAQVFANLLSNACKYSPAGSKVTVAAHREGTAVRVDVSDTGVGISKEDQTKLFTKFFRVDNSYTREASGTGLGLYITKLVVEAHGGDIWVASEEAQGTTFSCLWPGADSDTGKDESAIRGELALNS